jgi:ssDNA-binding replication factor A large subunit
VTLLHGPSCDRTSDEDAMNADVLATRVDDGIAVITLGSATRIYFDEEMRDALTEVLDEFVHQ